jgi:hypothetical protein
MSDRDTIGTALFVGGPRDGQLEAYFNDQHTYRVLAPPGAVPTSGLDTPPDWLRSDARGPVVEYRLEVFHTPTRDFYFWVLDVPPDDLMARLMVAYHQSAAQGEHSHC